MCEGVFMFAVRHSRLVLLPWRERDPVGGRVGCDHAYHRHGFAIVPRRHGGHHVCFDHERQQLGECDSYVHDF